MGTNPRTLGIVASAWALTRPIRKQQCCTADRQRKVGRYFSLKISAAARPAIYRKARSKKLDRCRVGSAAITASAHIGCIALYKKHRGANRQKHQKAAPAAPLPDFADACPRKSYAACR
jgi:hypothetical protein